MNRLRAYIDRWYYRKNPEKLFEEALLHFGMTYGDRINFLQARTVQERWLVVLLLGANRSEQELANHPADTELLLEHSIFLTHLMNLGEDLKILRR